MLNNFFFTLNQIWIKHIFKAHCSDVIKTHKNTADPTDKDRLVGYLYTINRTYIEKGKRMYETSEGIKLRHSDFHLIIPKSKLTLDTLR